VAGGGDLSEYEIMVEVRLRPGIADPQGATIERALPALGVSGVSRVSVGKAFRFRVDAGSEPEARERADDLAHRLLANPVIEVASVEVASVDVVAP
jgi:phosphoribosylformylglycinamidine synthase PurS subunit